MILKGLNLYCNNLLFLNSLVNVGNKFFNKKDTAFNETVKLEKMMPPDQTIETYIKLLSSPSLSKVLFVDFTDLACVELSSEFPLPVGDP